MRTIATLFAAGLLALGGCTTTDKVDLAIQKNLPQICSAATVAHSAFTAVASVTTKISAKTVAREAAAYDGLQVICVDSSNATAASVLIAATQAYLTIVTALREAEKV